MGIVSQATDRTTDAARHTVSHARANLIDLGTQVVRLINDLRDARLPAVDGILGQVGLQRRQSSLRPVLWLAAGAVATGALLLVVAPGARHELRRRVTGWLEREPKAATVQNGSEHAPPATHAATGA
jgi:hypothetical protein